MQAARCRDGCPATSADFVAARRPIVVTGSNTAAMAASVTAAYPATITTSIATSGSTTAASSTASSSTSATSATTFGQRGTYRQSGDCESDHEHSKSCHVAPPP